MAATKALLLVMLLVCVALVSTETAAARSLLGKRGEVVVKDKYNYIGYQPLDPTKKPSPGDPYRRPCKKSIYCRKQPPPVP